MKKTGLIIILIAIFLMADVAFQYRVDFEKYNNLRFDVFAAEEPSIKLNTENGTVVIEDAPVVSVVEEMTEVEEVVVELPGTEVGMPVDFEQLHSINEDIVAWIYIPAVDISYPILQGEDNDEYIHTDFEGNYAKSGSIFLESLNDCSFEDAYTIVYGHNMLDNSMFGKLHDLNKDLIAENPCFYVITPNGVKTYEYFAIRKTTTEDSAYQVGYAHDEVLQAFIDGSINASDIDLDKEVSAEDNIITLSTCVKDDVRLIVQAREVVE